MRHIRYRQLSSAVVALLLLCVPNGAQTPVNLPWVRIPGTDPGTSWRAAFDMGCVPDDEACQRHERPRHPVTLTRAFELLATEVTIGQFRAFVAATGYRTAAEREGWSLAFAFEDPRYVKQDGLSWASPGFEQDERHPVVHVNWTDAVAYCTWAGGRLPTEAEWEYGARGGVPSLRFIWGNDAQAIGITRAANVADESAGRRFPRFTVFQGYDDGYVWTAPVASFAPNGFGLWDMAGNVWEWTADWFAADAYATSAAIDPRGPASGRSKVVRGSSWGDEPAVLHASERAAFDPADRSFFHGFRCARELVSSPASR